MKVVCLSGGVGGAKLARGLHDVLAPGELTVIGNVGDDVEVLGLHVSPDLDSVLYALAGLNDEERGWGRAGETWRTLESAKAWGGEGWFLLGDLDLGLHLVRTQALRSGETLSAFRLIAEFPANFVKAYIGRRHALRGIYGFMTAMNYAFYRYLRAAKHWERRLRRKAGEPAQPRIGSPPGANSRRGG